MGVQPPGIEGRNGNEKERRDRFPRPFRRTKRTVVRVLRLLSQARLPGIYAEVYAKRVVKVSFKKEGIYAF